MALTSGTRIGVYEIAGALGAGGMGEVYRARDTRLDRVVAIKALPQAFAHDAARLARFEREAKLLASLAHPNIAGIHGIADSEGVPYLVLEFVAGDTLAARLSRGPLSTEEALRVGAQIASAVEAAHERGVVHRDLKPGNVMLTPAGTVKVLDFGIAKDRAATAASVSAVGTEPITAEGAVLGTAAYMSPEQARGLSVDRPTDVWAFGCILFECLAGRKPFAGATSSDMIAKVLEREPDWSALPGAAPPRLRDLIRRCLQKNVAERPADIGTLRRELEEMAHDSKAPSTGAGGRQAVPSLAVLYFENLSSDKDSDYFCAGITEDILTDLSKIKGLRVASRNAIAKCRGSSVGVSQVAAELGVTAVVEGSVRRAGERVRISAQLINAADGFHLWAERYDRTLQDVFAVQEEIASSIASALRVALTPSESEKLLRDRPEDARAYDLYLKGREQYYRYTQDSLREALSLFERATEIEPNYALAWAGIADCYGQMLQWTTSSHPEELGRLGLEAAQRAVSIDPSLPEGHKAYALVVRGTGDREGSAAALERAIKANPRFGPAWTNLGVYAFEVCNIALAERCIRRVLEIDPQDAFASGWLCQVLYLTNRLEEGFALVPVALRTKQDFFTTGAYMQTAGYYLRRGDIASARRTAAEARIAGARSSAVQMLEAKIAADSGRLDEAARHLTTAELSSDLAPALLSWGAEIALRRGERERAMQLIGRKISQDLLESFLRLIPALHPLLDEPKFAPRRSPRTLVWPAEAPPVAPEIAELFAGVRIESGLPSASGT